MPLHPAVPCMLFPIKQSTTVDQLTCSSVQSVLYLLNAIAPADAMPWVDSDILRAIRANLQLNALEDLLKVIEDVLDDEAQVIHGATISEAAIRWRRMRCHLQLAQMIPNGCWKLLSGPMLSEQRRAHCLYMPCRRPARHHSPIASSNASPYVPVLANSWIWHVLHSAGCGSD